MNDHWGFSIADKNYKSTKALVHYLVNAAGMNANFLLNVGPMPDGTVQPEFVSSLKELGDWMKKNGETIYGTRGGLMEPQDWGVLTTKGEIWYAHIIKKPEFKTSILLPNIKEKIKKCVLFDTKKPLKFKQSREGIVIDLEGIAFDDTDTIIELQLH
jgi:alpha-L-fucosidase